MLSANFEFPFLVSPEKKFFFVIKKKGKLKH